MSTDVSPLGPAPEPELELEALVVQMVETRRAIARFQAHEARLLSTAVDLALTRRPGAHRPSSADIPMREISAELAVAMRLSDRTVQTRMGDAVSLETRFPAVLTAWHEGRMDAGHVSAILDAGCGIADDDARRRFETMVIEIAAETTPAVLRGHAQAIAAQLDPGSALARTQRAQHERRVRVFDLDDGMARVLADLPAVLAHAIGDRLTQMARTVQTEEHWEAADRDGSARDGSARDAVDRDAGASAAPGVVTGSDGIADAGVVTGPDDGAEIRRIDQLRADVFADLLLAGAPAAHGDGDALGAISAHVQVTVPVLSLAGADEAPALLAGSGPIDLATARRLCAGAPGWDRVLTHPLTGAVLAVDRYRPSADIRRFLAARDEHCRFPGCRRPVRRCDADHTIDAATGGATAADNLAIFCRRHHTLKHATDWTVHQRGGGVLEWKSPAGRRYRDRPPAMVRFVPTGPPQEARTPLSEATTYRERAPF